VTFGKNSYVILFKMQAVKNLIFSFEANNKIIVSLYKC